MSAHVVHAGTFQIRQRSVINKSQISDAIDCNNPLTNRSDNGIAFVEQGGDLVNLQSHQNRFQTPRDQGCPENSKQQNNAGITKYFKTLVLDLLVNLTGKITDSDKSDHLIILIPHRYNTPQRWPEGSHGFRYIREPLG